MKWVAKDYLIITLETQHLYGCHGSFIFYIWNGNSSCINISGCHDTICLAFLLITQQVPSMSLLIWFSVDIDTIEVLLSDHYKRLPWLLRQFSLSMQLLRTLFIVVYFKNYQTKTNVHSEALKLMFHNVPIQIHDVPKSSTCMTLTYFPNDLETMCNGIATGRSLK